MKKNKINTDNNKINLKDFLKKYTAVSNKFVDEYYSFYEMCEKEKYGILLEDIVEYLEVKNNDRFYENFRKKYIENIDYIKKNILNEKMVEGKKYTFYYTSLDTFEKICMMSKAKKANEVRDYFIILRKFIQYYKDHISNMIIENILKYPNGYVYIILVNKGKNIFKFGKTKNIKNRLKNYATGLDTHPDIKFIILVKDKNTVENCVKSLIKDHQYKPNKEIYKVNIDIIKGAIFDCAELNIKYDEMYKNENIDSYIIFDDSEIINQKKKKLTNKKKSSIKKAIKKLSKKTTKSKKIKKISKKLTKNKKIKKLSKK
jgi:phage anti-repressor protein